MHHHDNIIETLPNEILLRILKHLYPPATFKSFVLDSICLEDSVWHEVLLDAHIDMVRVSRVSRLFHALTVSLAQEHARLIGEEKKNANLLHEMSETGLTYVEKKVIEKKGIQFLLKYLWDRRNEPYHSSISGNASGVALKILGDCIREETNLQAAKEESERSDHLTWLDIGRIHVRRAVRCARILSFHALRFETLVQNSQVRLFRASKDEWVDAWTGINRMRQT